MCKSYQLNNNLIVRTQQSRSHTAFNLSYARTMCREQPKSSAIAISIIGLSYKHAPNASEWSYCVGNIVCTMHKSHACRHLKTR